MTMYGGKEVSDSEVSVQPGDATLGFISEYVVIKTIKIKKKKEKWAKDRNGRFSVEGIQVDIKYAKNAQRP